MINFKDTLTTFYNELPYLTKVKTGQQSLKSLIKAQEKILRIKVKTSSGSSALDALEYYELGNPKKPTILLLHGFAASKESFIKIAALLSFRYHLIIPDMPGFGSSKRNHNRIYDVQYFAKTINFFIKSIKLSEFHLIGASLGAATSLELSLSYKNNIKSLVLIDSAGFYLPEFPSLYHDYAGGENIFQINSKEEFNLLLAKIYYNPPVLPKFIYEYVVNELAYNYQWLGKIMSDLMGITPGFDIKSEQTLIEKNSFNHRIKDITNKTLILWGEDDQFFPLETATLIQREIKNSKVITYKKCGHAPHHEKTYQVFKDICKFIT